MALDRITLSRFRNHAETALDGSRGFNLLVGENGAGKTNVLEAISLLAPGRGLRRAALAEMSDQAGDGGFAVGASLGQPGDAEPVRLGTYTEAQQPGRRRVRINSSESSALSLGEWLAIGWLTPAMDRLFMDSAGARRRFIDRMALAFDPAHARHATRYENALRERNRLLSAEQSPDTAWLDAIDNQLVEHAENLSVGRVRTIRKLTRALEALPEEPFARPDILYAPVGPTDRGDLLMLLQQTRSRDRAAGRTLVGPHRDDVRVTMASKAMLAANCSTGEQKAMLIAIVVAHAELASQGRPNVLLLDEVAAHLDPIRRSALFDRLRSSGAQVWMTGTELAPFDAIRAEAAVWQVEGGSVRRI